MKIKTLKDLKEFLGTLNEDQLSQAAFLQGLDEPGSSIAEATITDEDEYLTDEGYAPISTFEPDDEDDKLEKYTIRKVGYVYLFNEIL